MTQPPEPVYDVAHGDIGVARRLRKSLGVIRSSATDPVMRKKLDDLIAGRTSLRAFGQSDMFTKLLDQVPKQRLDEFAQMSNQEREKLAQQGKDDLERLRNQPPEETPLPPRAPHVDAAQSAPQRTPMAPAEPSASSAGTVHPGTRKPNRDQIVTPDEPDEDDLYFQERQQRGWLE